MLKLVSAVTGNEFVMDNGMSRGGEEETTGQKEEPTLRDREGSELFDTATSTTISTPSSSSSFYHSSRIDTMIESRSEFYTAAEFEIASSKSHWTQLDSDDDDVQYSPEDDLKHFESLKKDYRWDSDEHNFDEHNLVVGKKIAEGGQAEIFEAESDMNREERFVVKVFKQGYPLRALQRQWPQGMVAHWTSHKDLKSYARAMDTIRGAVLLKDERLKNRFAFLMLRMWGDLRKHIDIQMLNRKNNRGPPYSMKQSTNFMLQIVSHMVRLQEHGVLHRDLKASNVLVQCDPTSSDVSPRVYVADFECSVGVVGTGFWRAPEILQQLKDGVSMADVKFTMEADVYSYGMTCYEIVTGLTPFEGEPFHNYDHILIGKQPTLPRDLDPFIRDIIISCWQLDPIKRPTFSDIFEKLQTRFQQ